MKVALCFFGQPRFIKNPYSYISHKYWIIDKYNADIYIHSWINEDESNLNYSDWVNIRQEIINEQYDIPFEHKNSKNIILNKYKPKKYIFEKSKIFDFNDKEWKYLKEKEKTFYDINWNGYFHLSKNNVNNTLSQLYSINKVLNLINDKDKYDWIILSRFDNYIKDFPNLHSLNNNYIYINTEHKDNFNDVLMFGGMKFVEPLKLYDKVSSLLKDIGYFTPEEFKKASFYKNFSKDSEKRIKINVEIIRSENGNITQK